MCKTKAFFLKKRLTFLTSCGLIDVSRWQTCEALPLGNVSASHFAGDKGVIRETL